MEPGTIINAEQPSQPAPTPDNQPAPRHVKHSHRFLLLYLTVLIVAVLTGSIYAWQHHKVTTLQKQNNLLQLQNAQLQANVKILSAPKAGATNNNSPLVYKDWKTFCDTTNSTCFLHPSAWVISGSSGGGKTNETLTTPNSTVTVQYNAPVTAQALDQVFYITDIKDLNKTDLELKIVARVINNTPDFVIVDSAYLTSNHITVGKSVSFMDDARFTAKTTKASVQLNAKPSGAILANIKTSDQALAWFKTDDAKTILQLLQSFYYQ